MTQEDAASAAIRSLVPDPLPLRSITVPLGAVTGCDCGGQEWHRENCTIWAIPYEQQRAAVDAAHERERMFTAELNRKLRAALTASASSR